MWIVIDEFFRHAGRGGRLGGRIAAKQVRSERRPAKQEFGKSFTMRTGCRSGSAAAGRQAAISSGEKRDGDDTQSRFCKQHGGGTGVGLNGAEDHRNHHHGYVGQGVEHAGGRRRADAFQPLVDTRRRHCRRQGR